MIRATSLLAYQEVLLSLGERQIQVLKAIKEIQPCNNLMLSKKLNLPINSITPRCQELRKKGLVRYAFKQECPITKRMSMFYEIKKWIQDLQ
jgi:DNA-binding MarR family transcriptional regulator